VATARAITKRPDVLLCDACRVDARIVVHREAEAVKAPVAALFRDNAEWAVFVVSEGRAEKRRCAFPGGERRWRWWSRGWRRASG
jgi:hypothetical protein